MKDYVLGYAFDVENQKVLLIEKTKPDFQRGKLNGIGGKVEEDEQLHDAMIREFREETGIDSVEEQWEYRGKFSDGKTYSVFVYASYCLDINTAKSITEEIVGVYDANQLPSNTMPNVRWMVPYLLDMGLAKDPHLNQIEAWYL